MIFVFVIEMLFELIECYLGLSFCFGVYIYMLYVYIIKNLLNLKEGFFVNELY